LILTDFKCTQNLKKSASFTKLIATGGGTGGGFDKSSMSPEDCGGASVCALTHFYPPDEDSAYRIDKSQCVMVNKWATRQMLEQKMRKNKSFFEMKIQPEIVNNI